METRVRLKRPAERLLQLSITEMLMLGIRVRVMEMVISPWFWIFLLNVYYVVMALRILSII